MAKFIFSMQNLLNMKEKLEEQAKNEYSQAILRLHEEEDKYEALKKRQEDAEDALRLQMQTVLDVLEIRRREDAVEILKTYVKQQWLVVKQHEKEVEVARNKLQDAMQERKTFEKLREKAFEKFVEEEKVKERKEIDELVSYRFGTQSDMA